jgi:hypothetical protein
MKLTLSLNTLVWILRGFTLAGACLLVSHIDPDNWHWQLIGMVMLFYGAKSLGFGEGMSEASRILNKMTDKAIAEQEAEMKAKAAK